MLIQILIQCDWLNHFNLPFSLQTNYRGHRTRNHLKKTHNENKIVTFQEEPSVYKVTNTMTSSHSSSRSHQGHSSRPSSRSPGLSPKYDRDFALEHQRRVQMGKVIRRWLVHGGGTTSCDTSLKSTRKMSPRCDDVGTFLWSWEKWSEGEFPGGSFQGRGSHHHPTRLQRTPREKPF